MRVWMVGGGGGGGGGTNVSGQFEKILAICQFSVKWLLIINYETYMYLFIFLNRI